MFDIADFDNQIYRQNRKTVGQEDLHLSNALRDPAQESGVKQLGATSVLMFALLFFAVQSGPTLFGGATHPSASLDPSALETYAMHLDAPQADHDLVSLFDSINRS